MKRLLLATVAVVGLAIPGAGLAADLPVKAPPAPYVPPPFNWTGFYAGVNIGGGAASAPIFNGLTNVDVVSVGNSAFVGGGQLGYNYQFSPWGVLGVEWFFDGIAGGNNNGSSFIAPVAVNPVVTHLFGVSGKADWETTITARLGITGPQMDHFLIYTKGGGGWAQTQASITDLTVPGTLSSTKTTGGWVWGAGIEWAFAQNWTAKLEYQYLQLTNIGLNPGFFVAPFTVQSPQVQTVTVGVNYLFNYTPAPAPVVSRY